MPVELIAGAALATVLVVLWASVTVVPLDEATVVFRLGKTGPERVHRAGTYLKMPIVDMAVRVKLGEQATAVGLAALSQEGIALNVALQVRWRVVDPFKSVVSLAKPDLGVVGLTTTAICDAVGSMAADDATVYVGRVRDAVEAALTEALPRFGLELLEVGVPRVTRTTS